MARDRDDSGKFTRQLTDDRILQAFDALQRERSTKMFSARQIAEQLGVTRQAVDRRLRDLDDDGKVERIELGPRSVGWAKINRRKRHDRSSSGE
jgi:predicted ArsR family transcriptional regulator